MNKTLYEISDDILALERYLTDIEGDITDPDVCQKVDDWLLENQHQLDDKLDGYCSLIREIQCRAASRKEEAARLSALVKTDKAAIDGLKWRLKIFFQVHQHKIVQTKCFRINLATNGGVQPLILNVEPEKLPEKFRKSEVIHKADNDAIRIAIDKGEELDFAELGPRGQNIRIK